MTDCQIPARCWCCRRLAVRRFHSDASVRVALLSVTAAGVGLDFSAASVVVFAGEEGKGRGVTAGVCLSAELAQQPGHAARLLMLCCALLRVEASNPSLVHPQSSCMSSLRLLSRQGPTVTSPPSRPPCRVPAHFPAHPLPTCLTCLTCRAPR